MGRGRGNDEVGNGGAGRGEAGSRRNAPPRRIAAPPWGLPAPGLREKRWATKGVLRWPIYPPCSIRRGSPNSRGLCGTAYQPALPPPPPANAIAIRITSASTVFHLLPSGSGFFSPALLRVLQRLLPASLATTATSERHRDQDQSEFQHDSPHRLGFGLLHLCSFSRAADGDWLEQPSCHLQWASPQTPKPLAALRVTGVRNARGGAGRIDSKCL